MTQLGISASLQQSIMDPEYNFVRSWHPLRLWLETFIVGNYLSLRAIEDRVQGTIQQSKTGVPQLRGGAGDDSRTDYFAKKSGYTILYRTTTAGRLREVFLAGGDVNLGKAMARPDVASDFGYEAYGSFSYWTPNEWVAELYGRYCQKNLQNVYDICVLKLVARAHDIEIPGKTWRLTYGDEWRKLVCYSRTQKDYPEEIQKKHDATKVFIGPLSVDATPIFKAISSWQQVTANNVCKENRVGNEAVQYAFHTPPIMRALGNKAEVELFRFQSKKQLPDPKTWAAGR